MGYSVNILNSIRNEASENYQTYIPEATRDNIESIGNAFNQYKTMYNEFCEALLHKIGKTILESTLFENRLKRFKSGAILDQKDVEEIFVEMGKDSYAFDKDGKNPLGRRKHDNVKVVYHRQNRANTYDDSIGDLDFLRAFRTEGTLDSFIKLKIQAILTRAEWDEYVLMKELLATYDGYFNYGVPAITDTNVEKATKQFVKTVRKAILDLTVGMSNKYNKQGVMTQSKKGNLVAFIHKDVLAEVDVEVLAKSFNMGKTDIETTIIPMEDFGSLANTYALIVDEDFFKVFDTLSTMETQRNAQGLFTNYFYHVQQILSLSPFKNAVRLTTDEVTE